MRWIPQYLRRNSANRLIITLVARHVRWVEEKAEKISDNSCLLLWQLGTSSLGELALLLYLLGRKEVALSKGF